MLGFIGGLGGGLLGGLGFGLMSGLLGHSANQKQVEIANANLALQREMATTGMQKRVADLRAAGLNPMLAIHGMGAAQASGGTSVPQLRNIGEAASAGAIRGMEAQAISASIEKTKADTALSSASAMRERTQALLNLRTAGEKLPAEVENLLEGAGAHSAGAAASRAQTELTKAMLPKIDAEIKEIGEKTRLLGHQADTQSFSTAIRELDYYERQNIVPHLIAMIAREREKVDMSMAGAQNRLTAQESGFAKLMAMLGFATPETTDILQRAAAMAATRKD